MELSKKERRELKRQEKRQTELSYGRKKSIKFWAVLCAVLVVIALSGYFGFRSFYKVVSMSEIGNSYPIEGDKHVADGTKVEYKTNPPTSGDHYGTPANWGVYDREIPDEAVMHNLEHGGVWITYKPEISEIAKSKLVEIAKANSKVIMSPREKNDSMIALASWGRIYKPEVSADGVFDESAVKNFISKYRNTGPETVPESAPGKDY